MEILPTSITLSQWIHPDVPDYPNRPKNIIFLNPGESWKLIVDVQPPNATNKEVKWDTNNPKMTTIKNGIVTAHEDDRKHIAAATENKCDIILSLNKNHLLKKIQHEFCITPIQRFNHQFSKIIFSRIHASLHQMGS
jgi:hypothetical protein